MKQELFKIFWENAKSTYPTGTSKHACAILEEDFEKVMSEIIDLISERNEQLVCEYCNEDAKPTCCDVCLERMVNAVQKEN